MTTAYHGILLDRAFTETDYVPQHFLVFARKISRLLGAIYGVEIDEAPIEVAIEKLQSVMKDNEPLYVHLYNEDHLIVIFKHKYFIMSQDPHTWFEAIVYGEALGIPREQLDFLPHTFDQEEAYFV